MLTPTRAFAAALSAVALAAATVATAVPAQAATDIKIGVYPTTEMGAVQYAYDAGIFAKNGLNVTEFVTFPAPPAAINGLAGGSVQFTNAPVVPILSANVNGNVALKIIAPTFGFSLSDIRRAKSSATYAAAIDNSAMCVDPNSGIKTWKDLEGKRIAVPARKALGEIAISQNIKAAGGNPATVQWAQIGFADMVPAIVAKRIDAAYTVEPHTTACKNAGLTSIGSPNISFLDTESVVSAWITTDPYLAANPAAVQAFQKSIYEANQFAMKSKANAAKILAASAKLTKQPVAVAQAARRPFYPTKVTANDVAGQAKKMLDLGFLVKPANVPGLLAKQYQP